MCVCLFNGVNSSLTNTAVFAFALLAEDVELAAGPYGLKRVLLLDGFHLHGYGVWASLLRTLLLPLLLCVIAAAIPLRHCCLSGGGKERETRVLTLCGKGFKLVARGPVVGFFPVFFFPPFLIWAVC